MKLVIALLAALAAGCLAGGAWLWLKTWRFAHGDEYALDSGRQPSYSAGGVEADGSGIFVPAALLLVLGLFLCRFAWSLWRDEERRQRMNKEDRKREQRRR